MAAGRYFLFEHPAYATTWHLDCVEEVMTQAGVQRVLAHQCRLGLGGVDKVGEALVKLPTYFLANCLAIAQRLDRQCTGGHRHAGTVGAGKMLTQCAAYPTMLCSAIVQGFERRLRQDGRELAALGAEVSDPQHDLPLFAANDPEGDPDCDIETLDSKGGKLDVKLARAAREQEMAFAKERQIYEDASAGDRLARVGKPPVGTKWVDTARGDDQNPQYRSRLVVTEVRRPWSEKRTAATPPLEALRLLVAPAAHDSRKTGKGAADAPAGCRPGSLVPRCHPRGLSATSSRRPAGQRA